MPASDTQLALEITILSSGSVCSSIKPSLLSFQLEMFSFFEFLTQIGDPLPLDGTYAVLSQFLQSVKETRQWLEIAQIEVNTG